MPAGVLRGICWHQGESDAGKLETYPTKLAELVARFRKEFEAPALPFVAGELGVLGDPKRDDRHRAFNIMLAGALKKIPHTARVSSKDLRDKGDRLHFDSASARLLGERYAEAMIGLLKRAP